jgi:ferredoxin
MSGKLHPLQVKGRYYVDNDLCLCSDSCILAAPNNFNFKNDIPGFGSYVSKQPTTPEEEEACQRAMSECFVDAVRDDGESLLDWPTT